MATRTLLPILAVAALAFAAGWLVRSDSTSERTVAPVPEHPSSRGAQIQTAPQLTAEDGGARAETSRTTSSSRAEGPDPGKAGPVLVARTSDSIAAAVRRLRETYQGLSGGAAIREGEVVQFRESMARSLDGWPRGLARDAWKREQLRQRIGELDDPATVRIQVRTRGQTTVHMADPRWLEPRSGFQAEPLDLDEGFGSGWRPALHVRGGFVPHGHILIVERVAVHAWWPAAPSSRRGRDAFVEVELEALKRSKRFLSGGGVFPPGKAFEVTRIDYRGRLSAKGGSHSDLVIRAGRRTLVSTNADEGTRPAGTWTGSVVVREGGRRGLGVTASYHALVEARVQGRLIDDPGR